MKYRGEIDSNQKPVQQQSVDNFESIDRRRPSNDITTCNCCTENLARLIKCEFRRGDPIGITFVGEGSAFIFVGVFLALEGTILVISDLFIDKTISFIPLCSVDSIEMGCALANNTGSPMVVAPQA